MCSEAGLSTCIQVTDFFDFFPLGVQLRFKKKWCSYDLKKKKIYIYISSRQTLVSRWDLRRAGVFLGVADVTTTGASAGSVAAEVVTAVVPGITLLPVGMWLRLSSLTIALYTRSLNSSASCISASKLSSSVRSNISESNCVRIPSFSSRLHLNCAKWAGSVSSSTSRASTVFIVLVAELLWPPLILRFRAKPSVVATSKLVVVYFWLCSIRAIPMSSLLGVNLLNYLQLSISTIQYPR